MISVKVTKVERDSNFELCRIACIVYIVFYHLFIHVDNDLDDLWFTKPLTAIVHIGVVVFVMISGYYGIKRRIDKLLYILSLIAFYNLIGFLFAYFVLGRELGLSAIIRIFLPFSNGGYWFMKSYLVLFLIAPYINMFLERLQKREFGIYLLILCFIVFYLGGVFNSSIGEGRGIVAFVLSYCIGRYIRIYFPHLISYKLFKMNAFLPYLLACLLLIILYGTLPAKMSKALNHFFFNYNSIGLYIMSVLFFLAFKQISIKSHFVNNCAKSVLAVYLIHECSFTRDDLIYHPFHALSTSISNPIFILVSQFLFAVIVVVLCIGIDKIRDRLYIWFRIDKSISYLNKKGETGLLY